MDKEIAKSEQLLAESNRMRTLLAHQDKGIHDRDHALLERDMYIDKLEQKVKDLQSELEKKEIMLKQASSKSHTKNSRSTMLNPMLQHMAAYERREEGLQLRESMVSMRQSSFVIHAPIIKKTEVEDENNYEAAPVRVEPMETPKP